jgi:predicted RNase H-like nuclease (RuvC/YqgF family)
MFTWLKRIVIGAPFDAGYIQLPESIDIRQTRGSDDILEYCREREVRIQAMLDISRPERVRERKKEQLEEELKDAKWILKYERELTALQEEITEEIDRAREVDRSPERLQKLDRHLVHLRAGTRVR